jgi:hypothetical protein
MGEARYRSAFRYESPSEIRVEAPQYVCPKRRERNANYLFTDNSVKIIHINQIFHVVYYCIIAHCRIELLAG